MFYYTLGAIRGCLECNFSIRQQQSLFLFPLSQKIFITVIYVYLCAREDMRNNEQTRDQLRGRLSENRGSIIW